MKTKTTIQKKVNQILNLLDAGSEMVDKTAPEIVEVLIRSDGKVVWVNVDGVCCFRACRVGQLLIKDERVSKVNQQLEIKVISIHSATKTKTKWYLQWGNRLFAQPNQWVGLTSNATSFATQKEARSFAQAANIKLSN